MYIASLYPDRISVRYEHDNRSARTKWEERMITSKNASLANLEKNKTTWSLSYQTKRKMRDSVSYMSSMSRARTIKTPRGKFIYNFKTSFITLTLPSKQIHTDLEIKKCLNNFLTTMRQRFGLVNYVWKAELQKNENIHFHIITDVFIHHTVIRYYWNKALNVLGYVDRYSEQFSRMSLQEYAAYRNLPISQALNGFLFGRNSNWMSPATEQVKAVQNDSLISYYVAKYVTKEVQDGEVKSEEDKERILNFGRVWARSQSLSKVSFVTRYCWQNLKEFISSIDAAFESFHKVEFDYCTVYYFNFKGIVPAFKKWLYKKMTELAYSYGYPAPA